MEDSNNINPVQDNSTINASANNEDIYYKGQISEAIALAKQKSLIFAVLVHSQDEEVSQQLLDVIDSSDQIKEEFRKNTVLLKLEAASPETTQLKQFYQFESVPCILYIGLSGVLYQKNEGIHANQDILQSIKDAVSKHQQQLLLMYFSGLKQQQQQQQEKEKEIELQKENALKQQQEKLKQQQQQEKEKEIALKQQQEKLKQQQEKLKQQNNVSNNNINNKPIEKNTTQQPNILTKTTSPKPTSPVLVSSPPIVKTDYSQTTIVCKLTNGFSIKDQFSANARLLEVKRFIDTNRNDGKHSYYLMTTYPKRIFMESDMGSTLKELDLVPSATILLTSTDPNVKPKPAPETNDPSKTTSTSSSNSSNSRHSSHNSNSSSSSNENEGSYLSSVKGYFSKMFNPFWHPPSQEYDQESSNSSHGSSIGNRHSSSSSSSSSSSTSSYSNVHSISGGSSGNNEKSTKKQKKDKSNDGSKLTKRTNIKSIHQLGEKDHDKDDDPSHNNYYNGNSTQFK